MTMPQLPPAVAAAFGRRGALAHADLVTLGVCDSDLRRWVRRRLLIRVRAGVYALAPNDAPGMLRAQLHGALLAGEDVVVSHRAAAWVHGLPVWGGQPRPEVTRAVRGARLPGVVVHRYGVESHQVVDHDGLRVTCLERTLIDVSRVLPIPEALGTWDAALAILHPDLERVDELLDVLGDINFRKRVRQTAQWADALAENVFESFSRGHLLLQGLPHPLLQWWVGDGRDIWYRPDKLWPRIGLIGEADGLGKYRRKRFTGPDALALEKQRQDWFEDNDFTFVRWGVQKMSLHPDFVADRWRVRAERQQLQGWTWPQGVWLVCPGDWPPSRSTIRDESPRVSPRFG